MQKRESLLIRNLARLEIFIMVIFVFSFAYLVSNTGFVSGQDAGDTSTFGDSLGTAAPAVTVVSPASNPSSVDSFRAGVGNPKIPTLTQQVTIGSRTFEAGAEITSLEVFEGGAGQATIAGETVQLTGGQVTELQGLLESHGGLYKQETFELFGNQIATGGVAHLLKGLTWGLSVAAGIKMLGGLFGFDDALTDALSKGAFGGIMTYQVLQSLGPTGGFTGGPGPLAGDNFLVANSPLIGLGVGIAIFLLSYKKQSQEVVQFQCLPYEPPLGGNSCERCNEDPYRPCSEYRCRSLGQACELVNSGTEEEKCVWVNPQDVNSPTITPWPEVLTAGHEYTNHATRPSSLGTNIVRNSGECLAAFTPLEFGFKTNEPAQCKISDGHTEKYEDMVFFVGETNYFLEEHTQRMNLPGPDSLSSEAPELENDGIFDLYVRCIDANGNENVDEFVFSFCVDPSPDTTPPIIVDTSIQSGSAVAFEVEEVPVEVYTNEPADCKWSVQDKNYDDMENEMSCSSDVTEINADLLYTCASTLTGIKDREENKFYFRCKDQPDNNQAGERNVNVQSFPFVLRGTEPLNIIDFGPNGTVTDNADVVNVELFVETSNGADEGVAACFFSDTGEEGSFVSMFETNSFEHKQLLTLPEGDYEYHFRCIDAGGNSDEATAEFSVFVDNDAPRITRAYKELDALKVVTDEDSECAYSLNSCNFNFDEGIVMIHSNPGLRQMSFAPWDPNTIYYIKCRDDFGNQPDPNTCSLIASATNIQ